MQRVQMDNIAELERQKEELEEELRNTKRGSNMLFATIAQVAAEPLNHIM